MMGEWAGGDWKERVENLVLLRSLIDHRMNLEQTTLTTQRTFQLQRCHY